MNVGGEFTVDAPRDGVFRVLRDAHSFVRFVDGVQDLEQIDPNRYQGVVKFKFAVTVEPSEIAASIEGKPLGLVGRLTAKSLTLLQDAGPTTKVTYSVDATLAGKLGSIGQAVLHAKAKDMEMEFAERLRAAFVPAATGTAEAR